ncbi:peptide chain release factor N(5)-glutamine methyltransferase [Pollutibacter soli]|uniref:peptide chain release factor N(5)-glutamine methyltransferase n=1 Tax=Pollutibacter soli TaxID=3034157 RepID=UPI003013C270
MTIISASQLLKKNLQTIYDQREAFAISSLVMEKITGKKKSEQVLNPYIEFDPRQQLLFDKYINELLQKRPLQYVLNEAWFCGMKLYVNENVLIPRPETEELVQWSVDSLKLQSKQHPRVLDVGTGSGCIALGIKKNFPSAEVFAIDISESALKVASRNAEENNLSVQLQQMDITGASSIYTGEIFDLVVSNPPYIPLSDKPAMEDHVVEYEPHLALFVDDDNPLKFYDAIAGFFLLHAVPGSLLFFETHWQYAPEIKKLLEKKGLTDVEIRKDLQGHERMIRAKYP